MNIVSKDLICMGLRSKVKPKLPKVTFVIPSFNEEALISTCLDSVMKQKYPKNKIELILVDGGSTDNTINIAKKYGCKVFNNPKKLAEPALVIGTKKASGDLIVALHADGTLVNEDWINSIVQPFIYNEKVVIAIPDYVDKKGDNLWTRYYNEIGLPFNDFIYSGLTSNINYNKFKILSRGSTYVIPKLSKKKILHLGLANGVTFIRNMERSESSEYDDILPIFDVIKKGGKIAFVFGAKYHHNCVKDFSVLTRKYRHRIKNFFFRQNKEYKQKIKFFDKKKKIKILLWFPYSLTFVFPLIFGLIGFYRTKKSIYLLHPFLCFYMSIIWIIEIVKILVIKKKVIISKNKKGWD